PDVHPAVRLQPVLRPGRVAPAEFRVDRPAHGPPRRERSQHAAGPLQITLEGAEALRLLAHHAGQAVQLLEGAAGRLVGDARRRRRPSPDRRAPVLLPRFGPERRPDAVMEPAPGVDLGADLADPRLEAVESQTLLGAPGLER